MQSTGSVLHVRHTVASPASVVPIEATEPTLNEDNNTKFEITDNHGHGQAEAVKY